MPIEVTWTDDDYVDEEEQKIGHGQEEEENLSRSPYSGDDEYEEDEDRSPQTKFEEQWQQFNSPNDQQFQDKELPPQEEEKSPWGYEQEQQGQLPGGDIGVVKSHQGPLVAVETTYKVKTSSSPKEEDTYLCGLASILLEHCDLRGISKGDDLTTQVTVITQMDDPNDPMVDTSGEWEHLVTPKGMETPDKGQLLDIPLEDQDNQSMDGSIRSTRTSATQETERTAIETEFAPIQLSSRTKSRRKSSFMKWSSKKKAPRAPTIIPPVEDEAITLPTAAAVEKEGSQQTPAPMEISTSSLDLQREISLLEFDEATHADKNLRIVGLSPAESFEEDNSVTSPTPVTDDAASEGNYLDDDEATLLSDPRNNKGYMVKAIQSIEVIYDPNLFDEDEEEKVGDGTRYCSLWRTGAKKSRGRFYR